MLTVKALRCVNLRNVAEGTNERQDPYVTLTLQEDPKLHSKTEVCYSGGQNPQWWTGNWMRLPVPRPNMTCLVQVWDKHAEDADELIASGTLKLGRYDDDGTEEEPLGIELFWQNGLPAGQFQCVVTYEPPLAHIVGDDQNAATFEEAKEGASKESWLPWLRLHMRNRSGKVKEFLISRTTQNVERIQNRGRTVAETRVPQVRSFLQQQYTEFRSRPPLGQAAYIALGVLLVAMPWPRMLAGYVFSGIFGSLSWTTYNIYSLFAATFGAMFGAVSWMASWVFSIGWRAVSLGLILGGLFSAFVVAPVLGVLCLPRFLGWSLTRLASMVTGGHLISFGTISIVPWITDFKRLKFRLIVVDFMMGNPRDKGYTPRLMSFNRFEMVGSVAFADFRNIFTLTPVRTPLRDVADFKRYCTLRLDHLEIDGVAVNLEVNDKNRLNLLDLVTDFDRAQVERELARRDINPRTFRFPNCLEVQVLGARNLRPPSGGTYSDPFYVVRVRKQELVSTTLVKTLNPAFPPRVEQFFVNDPSAVLTIDLKDENVARRSGFLGRWNTTMKHLLIDPRKCKYSTWERLSEDERRQGWIGFWAPLVDEHFHKEGLLGEVNIRMRWVFNPALPDVRPGERRESQTPLQQLNILRHEIRQRLGDLDYIKDILKHIPVLLDFQGVFVINDTKISVRDLLYGRPTDRDNVVKQILVREREETEKKQSQQVQDFPRSLKVRETPAAIDRDRVDISREQEAVIQESVDRVDEVIVESADPTKPLPKNLTVDVKTTPGLASMPAVPGALGDAKPAPEIVHRLDEREAQQAKPSETTSTTYTSEQERLRTEPAGTTSTPAAQDTTAATKLNKTDVLSAVYPEALVSSAPSGGEGYVRGDLEFLGRGPEGRVYLGSEDDDEAAEERNEDRFDDDEREYDQDGREFIKVKPIVWRRQFLTRHGDPGINVFKFLERLVRGLLPKLSSDSRLQKALAGSALKGVFSGGLTSTSTTSGEPVDPGMSAGTRHNTGVIGAIKGMAHAVKDQAKLVEKKVLHPKQQDVDVRTDTAGTTTMASSSEEFRGRESEAVPASELTPKAVSTERQVQAQDENFYKNDLVIAGSLEAMWQGRHRITSLFRRWKLWHVEVKGDQVFYHRIHALGSTSASDAVWYTLDLTWLSDMYVTESSRVSNNELVLRFVQEDSTLHFRLPSKVTSPTLAEWFAALKNVQTSQQDRRRLGSMAKNESMLWPGEEAKPAHRPRGSSLAAPSQNASATPAMTTTQQYQQQPMMTMTQPTRASDTTTTTTQYQTTQYVPVDTQPQAVRFVAADNAAEEKMDISTAVEEPATAPRRAPPAVPPLNPAYQSQARSGAADEQQMSRDYPSTQRSKPEESKTSETTPVVIENKPMTKQEGTTTTTTLKGSNTGEVLETPPAIQS